MISNENLLGSYNPLDGGFIRLHMGNTTSLRTEISTELHETYHAVLLQSTTIGMVVAFLQQEVIESSSDAAHCKKVQQICGALIQRTRYVQEVYANNMELLTIQKDYGLDEFGRVYALKNPEGYNCMQALYPISFDPDLSIGQKLYLISRVCRYAMNINIGDEAFINALQSLPALAKYFEGPDDLSSRLEGGLLSFWVLRDESELRADFWSPLISFARKVSHYDIFKYTGGALKELSVCLDEYISLFGENSELPAAFEKYMFACMEDAIAVFNINMIKLNLVSFSDEITCYPFLIVKDYFALENKQTNFFLVGMAEGPHIGVEVTPIQLTQCLWAAPFASILCREFDVERCLPAYFAANQLPLFIVIEYYHDCMKELQRLMSKDGIYIGNLYNETIDSYYTFLFFREKADSSRIYVFPTTEKLADTLIISLELEDVLLFVDDKDFLQIFQSLKSKNDIINGIRWMVKLLIA